MPLPFSRPAYVLVAHGSSDPRPGRALANLAAAMAEGLQARSPHRNDISHDKPMVRGAELECQPTSLEEQILGIHQEAQANQRDGLVIIPLFLSAGVHAMEDIPEAIANLETALASTETGDALPMAIAPILGQHPDWANWITHHWQTQLKPGQTPVVIGHGTRRVGGNQGLEGLARSIEARLAFWAIAPKLPETVDALMAQNKNRLTLLPYFLFSGGITDAIARQIEPLKLQYSSLNLSMGTVFGEHPNFAEFLAEAYGSGTPSAPEATPELVLQ